MPDGRTTSDRSSLPVEATIHDLSTDGRGVVRIEGVVYFVTRGLPGDHVLLRLESRSKPPSADVAALLEPSPLRVPHPCPHAADCQGSLWGGLDYPEQLKHKHDLVDRTLRKAVGNVDVLPTVLSPQQWRYRNRISLNVWSLDGRLQVGFHTDARREIGAPVHTCQLPSESVSACLNTLAAALQRMDSDSVRAPRRIQIHDTIAGAGLLLIFAGQLSPGMLHDWSHRLETCAPGGIWLAESSAAGIINYHRPILHAEHAKPMQTEWLGQVVNLHPASFCQANAGAANRVGERLLRFGEQETYHRIWDLYGGFGALGLAAAVSQRRVTVFELSRLSQDPMQKLALQLSVTHAEFVAGDLLRTFPSYAGLIEEDDLVILDPPRSGAHRHVLSLIMGSTARRLIYLSCNPARLGRDMVSLIQGGFKPVEIQPYDFFPQTPSTEVLVVFRRS